MRCPTKVISLNCEIRGRLGTRGFAPPIPPVSGIYRDLLPRNSIDPYAIHVSARECNRMNTGFVGTATSRSRSDSGVLTILFHSIKLYDIPLRSSLDLNQGDGVGAGAEKVLVLAS